MRRGWHCILVAAVVLGGAAGPLCAQPGELMGPAVPAPPASETAARAADPAADPGAAQEATPLGGEPADTAPLRARLGAPVGGVEGGESRAAPSLRAGEGWWRTAAALALVIALIMAIGVGVRSWAQRSGGLLHAMGPGGRAPSGVLQVLGRYPVGRGQTLVLLKLDRRVLLLSQSSGAKGGGMQTLCALTDPDEVASILMLTAEAEGRSLAARFREMVSGYEHSHEQAERTLAPVAVELADRAPAPPDPVGNLRTRLDSLRHVERGTQA